MEHKFRKFKSNGIRPIRWVPLTNGTIVAFTAEGYDLSVENKSVDLDGMSDVIVEKLEKEDGLQSSKHRAFEYKPGFGFVEVDSAKQTWFNFDKR